MPRLKGNSPVRGNVCNADKRVPVSGRKGARQGGEVLKRHVCVPRAVRVRITFVTLFDCLYLNQKTQSAEYSANCVFIKYNLFPQA